MTANPKDVGLDVTKLKVTQIGNSLGVVLPKELVAEMGLAKGDELFATRARDGLMVTKSDPDFEAQMRAARQIMRDYRNTLRELAK